MKMKVNVDLRLKDVPGQLVSALDPISSCGGNIRGVVHHHDVKDGGRIAVNVTFEASSDPVFHRILDEWEKRDVEVAKINSFIEAYPIRYLLVGDISSAEMESVTRGLESIENVVSIDVRYTGAATSSSHTALITGTVSSQDTLKTLDDFFYERAQKKNYLLVRGLEL